jgi:prephenate dehydratase
MTVAALGPEGTFSHEIAVRLYDRERIVLLPTIREVFRFVKLGDGRGVVPLENSEAGGVGPTLEGLQDETVRIIGEAYMEIRHHLASAVQEDGIRVIYAHPQSHEQCSRFVDALGVPVVHTSSNAASAWEAKEQTGAAAITSGCAAGLAGLTLLHRDIQNDPGNTTRFVVISASADPCRAPEKCSIIVDPGTDRAGLLYEILGAFAERGINLTRIESRPSRRGIGKYIFFIDFETKGDCGPVLAQLRSIANVRELGEYCRLEVSAWK